MFFQKPRTGNEELESLETELKSWKEETERLERSISRLKHDHELEIENKELEWTYNKDKDVQKLRDEKVELEKKLAVALKQLEMLEKMIDLNSDVLDVKSLVEKLISKLPEINLQNLTINADAGKINK